MKLKQIKKTVKGVAWGCGGKKGKKVLSQVNLATVASIVENVLEGKMKEILENYLEQGGMMALIGKTTKITTYNHLENHCLVVENRVPVASPANELIQRTALNNHQLHTSEDFPMPRFTFALLF